MAKRLNMKIEKAKRNLEYALRFKKKKRPKAPRPIAFSEPTGGPNPAVASNRTFHEAVCNTCGAETTVPFKPTGSRPVLCRSCFEKAA